jgi:RimJ/RimL family protein N-acetyltransferase
MHMMEWLSPWADTNEIAASGFVWEEDGRIIGNLSLIPFQKDGRRTYLLANVAVHPNFRRRGIARALTQRALGFLRRRNIGEVWLQVREDNQDAQDLYRSVGFVDRAIRTTWRMQPGEVRTLENLASTETHLRHRKASDWPQQKRYFDQAYPHYLRWNYPVNFERLSPGIVQTASNFVEGLRLRHWTYIINGRGQGQITWQKTETFANNLWLAFNETEEHTLLPEAMLSVLKNLSQDHTISIDYPKGRSEEVFKNLGFRDFRTLIWMSCHL